MQKKILTIICLSLLVFNLFSQSGIEVLEEVKLKNGKSIFILTNGEWIDKTEENFTWITVFLEDALDFSDGLARVVKGGKKGYINKKGNFIIQHQDPYPNDFSEGLAAIKKGGKYGYINKQGNLLFKFRCWIRSP